MVGVQVQGQILPQRNKVECNRGHTRSSLGLCAHVYTGIYTQHTCTYITHVYLLKYTGLEKQFLNEKDEKEGEGGGGGGGDSL